MSQPTNTFIIHRQSVDNWSVFIGHWAKTYAYLDDNSDYDEFVVSRNSEFAFDEFNLRKLFEWKNKTGEKLTAKKEESVKKTIGKLDQINQLRKQWNDDDFRTQFGKISAVWQTYLMHIIQPDRFPIFDQHVYRAYTYLQAGLADELQRLNTIKQKLAHYEQYRSFFNDIKQKSGCSSRDIDKALWAFGKFIKQYSL